MTIPISHYARQMEIGLRFERLAAGSGFGEFDRMLLYFRLIAIDKTHTLLTNSVRRKKSWKLPKG